MLTDQDFNVFQAPTLAGRLRLIQTQLDPKFEALGGELQTQLEAAGLPPLTLHIAKHQRRHKNPPPDTWLALSVNHRGYKMTPHLELGLWDDRLFLWLGVLQEAKTAAVRVPFDELRPLAARLPSDFELAADHTSKAALPLTLANYDRLARRYQTVARSEFLLGKTYLRTDPIWAAPDELWAELQDRVARLAPLWQRLLAANVGK